MPRKWNVKASHFGERVRELRAGYGLTQQQVADRTTVSVSYISKVENVVIGADTAAGAAELGARVALIERKLIGGDCLNVGCVPSKGVIGADRVAATVRNAAQIHSRG